MFKSVVLFIILLLIGSQTFADKGLLLYSNTFAKPKALADWKMEGPGQLEFEQGWMTMWSPNEAMHHVFWCPEDFPESFIAEWDVRNLHTEAGLAIIFFAAQGMAGEDIFSAGLQKRDGTFKQYVEGDIRSYHISYYANAAHKKNRGHANLRKNNTFTLLQQGKDGIPASSGAIHQLRLRKKGAHIQMWVDERKIIDYIDKQEEYWKEGKIGFRQMQWTRFSYRNFKVWAINDSPNQT